MTARLTAEQRQLRSITEAAWQRDVENILTDLGWMWFHAPDNRPVTARSGRTYVQNIRAGYLDLTAVRDQRVVWLELKTETGPITPEQHTWIRWLRDAGQEAYVARPSQRRQVCALLTAAWPLSPEQLDGLDHLPDPPRPTGPKPWRIPPAPPAAPVADLRGMFP